MSLTLPAVKQMASIVCLPCSNICISKYASILLIFVNVDMRMMVKSYYMDESFHITYPKGPI